MWLKFRHLLHCFFFNLYICNDHITTLCDIHCPPQVSLNADVWLSLTKESYKIQLHLSCLSYLLSGREVMGCFQGSRILPIPPPPYLNTPSPFSLNSMFYVSGSSKGNIISLRNVFVCMNCN